MDFKVGEQVGFLFETGGGVVRKIVNENQFLVEKQGKLIYCERYLSHTPLIFSMKCAPFPLNNLI